MIITFVLWVRACIDCEPLFSVPEGLRADTRRCYWIREQVIEVNTCDMREDMGHTVTEVKNALPMSHNTLTIAEEHIQW
jgi:hypothetical protein